jgi:hypothetical protein
LNFSRNAFDKLQQAFKKEAQQSYLLLKNSLSAPSRLAARIGAGKRH